MHPTLTQKRLSDGFYEQKLVRTGHATNRSALPRLAMRRLVSLVVAISLLIAKMGYASELNPWEVEFIQIGMPDTYSVPIDDTRLFFEMPDMVGYEGKYAKEVSTSDVASSKYLKISYGHFTKPGFILDKGFYWLGIPLFGSYGGMGVAAQVHIMSSVETRAAFVADTFKGDFSKPVELQAYLERNRGVPQHSTPVEEVIVNERKWYRYWWNSSGYPNDLREVYVTGLSPDRFLEIYVRQYPVPFIESRYPTYPTEDRMPSWMKETHKFKEQVIRSLRISREQSNEAQDLYVLDKTVLKQIAEPHKP